MIKFKKEELNKLFDGGMKPGVVYTIIDSAGADITLIEDIYSNLRHSEESKNIIVTRYLRKAASESLKPSYREFPDVGFYDGGYLKGLYLNSDYSDIRINELSEDSSDLNVYLCGKPITYAELEKLRKDIKDTNAYAVVIISNETDKPKDAYYSADSLIFVRKKDGHIWADSAGSDMYVLPNE